MYGQNQKQDKRRIGVVQELAGWQKASSFMYAYYVAVDDGNLASIMKVKREDDSPTIPC